MAGGVAAFDFNNDGRLDLFFPNGAEMPSLRKTGAKFSIVSIAMMAAAASPM